MKRMLVCAALATALGPLATPGAAAEEFEREIKARKAVMQIYAFNLGVLGAMAKGKADYDPKVAGAAAQNLLALSKMDNGAMWPEGSGAQGALEGKTRAKPEIWSRYPEVGEKHQALTEALTKMAAEAGTGLDGVKANMGAVGKGCKGCHEPFRVPKKQ